MYIMLADKSWRLGLVLAFIARIIVRYLIFKNTLKIEENSADFALHPVFIKVFGA